MERIFKLALVTMTVFFLSFLLIKLYVDWTKEDETEIIFERKKVKKEYRSSWEEDGMIFQFDDTTDIVIELKMMRRSDTLITNN